MPLTSPENAQRLARNASAGQGTIFEAVRLPAGFFEVGGLATDVLVSPRDRGGLVVFVDERVRYTGNDVALRAQFAGPAVNGRRPLCVLAGVQPGAALALVDELLGLAGVPPRIPGQEPRTPQPESVVRRPAAARNLAHDTDGLGRFGVDLVTMAREGHLEQCIGRTDYIDDLVLILGKQKKNSPVLLGEAGVGKTAIVEGLAARVAEGLVPTNLADARIYDINLAALSAEWGQQDLRRVFHEILGRAREDPNCIVFIDELHLVAVPGSNVGQDLKPVLGRSGVKLIGATTYDEYGQYIRPDPALRRRFIEFHVSEMSPAEALEVLRQLRPSYQEFHELEIPDALLEETVKLAARFFPDRRFPDKALDLLDESCSRERQVLKAAERRPR